MADPALSGSSSADGRVGRAAKVLIVSSVTFAFISYWRTAAIVLCDLSSTAYYIGAIVENAIGRAAPWFILAVMLFSYAMRSVYIESSALYVRGGVYRVVKEAMGGFLAKLSVSALLFDYVLTGPISAVAAGQYIVGLVVDFMYPGGAPMDEERLRAIRNWCSAGIACAITVYFFWQNLRGIPESSDKALKIMIATTIMVVIVLVWSGVTLAVRGAENPIPSGEVDFNKKYLVDDKAIFDEDGNKSLPFESDAEGTKRPKYLRDAEGNKIVKRNDVTGEQEDPLGLLGKWFPWLAGQLRQPDSMLSIIGVIGLIIAFGHSVLAMSGEETLAQVYREVESPKLRNFEKAAFIVFVYSLLMTAAVSFLAVLLIPESERLAWYNDNLLGGLAMHQVGWRWLRLLLNAFVVVVGFLILSGAVNTSIIGSNGVLNRVAEDGVLPDWFLKPHRRFGTTHRILYLITGMQLVTILASRGDVNLLGEAYAFGVVWSFVFKTLAMVVLRFKDKHPREFKVPLNFHFRGVEIPLGLVLIFMVVFLSALANLFTKEVATISGAIFTVAFLIVFMITEFIHERRHRGHKEHLEQFNKEVSQEVTGAGLGLAKPYRRLVAIRSTQNLFMLERSLLETDPSTTDVVVMTAKLMPMGGEADIGGLDDLDRYDQQLMTAVVDRAEKAGKQVKPLIVPTNNPLHAVLKIAKDIGAQEVVIGASNKFTAEEQLDQLSLYWINLHDGPPPPLTVRILNRERDVYFDLEGGNRIPKIGERQARSVSELRAAGVGVDRVLLVHDGSPADSDLFRWVLTMLDPEVTLDLVRHEPAGNATSKLELIRHETAAAARTSINDALERDREQAERLGRKLKILVPHGDFGPEVVRLAREGSYDLVIVGIPEEGHAPGSLLPEPFKHLLRFAHCAVFLAAHPRIPEDVEADAAIASPQGQHRT